MQLDLFDNPPPPMNPNKNPMAPDCFRDYEQYSEWLKLARASKEPCTICEDCLDCYKKEMKLQQRCHFEWHSVTLLMEKKVAFKVQKQKVAKAPVMKSKEIKELRLDKLEW